MENISMKKTPIQEFYKGTNIFITGGTGFVGRILIEKLLRACPDLSKIYVLIRQKKGIDGHSRLNEMFNDVIFEKLKTENPSYRQKVFPISGDCSEPNLGLNEHDTNIIINEVNIVFHVAATVNFDAKLQNATFINVRATRDVIAIIKRMKQLKFMVHVSTAYTHCHLKVLQEAIYPSTGYAHQLITLAETLSGETMDKLTKPLLGEYPNTYSMTKSASEELFEDIYGLPVAILRPAIIVSSYKEPIPGWINNLYGPQGVSTAASMGILRTLHCDGETNSNIVPVDMCVNALIAIPWEARMQYDEVTEKNITIVNDEKTIFKTPVYNFESYSYNPLNWKRFRYLTQTNGYNYPPAKMMGVYFFHLNKHKFVHYLYMGFLHFLPALVVDGYLKCVGKKPMLYKAYEKIHHFSNVISYFSTNNFVFNSKKLDELNARMSDEDKQLFFCDLRKLDWNEFFKTYLLGCRVYLLKDPIETIPAGKKNYTKLKIYTSILLLILAFVAFSFFQFLWSIIEF